MYEKILITLDGSKASGIVLPYVEEIAAKSGAEIILVSVSEITAAETDHLYRSYLEHIKAKVGQELKDWGARKEIKIQNEVLLGKPASKILHYAQEHNVSLIVMASRGRSDSGPWLLGNIAAKVLRAADRPVLLIRTPASDAALQQKKLIKKILLPLDGSLIAEVVIPHAEELAKLLEAELILFRAVEPLSSMLRAEMVEAWFPMQEEDRRTIALAYLEEASVGFQEKGIRTSIEVSSGPAAEQIISYAEANAIDLIVMATHGYSGVSRWVFGSVADKILHTGDTPVFVVRATKMWELEEPKNAVI